jgi:cell division protein FtsB
VEEKKLRKIVSLVTAAVIVILFAMIVGLVFQFVSISKLKAEKKALDEKIAYYTQYNQSVSDKINYLEDSEALEDMYRALGYGKEGDIKFE